VSLGSSAKLGARRHTQDGRNTRSGTSSIAWSFHLVKTGWENDVTQSLNLGNGRAREVSRCPLCYRDEYTRRVPITTDISEMCRTLRRSIDITNSDDERFTMLYAHSTPARLARRIAYRRIRYCAQIVAAVSRSTHYIVSINMDNKIPIFFVHIYKSARRRIPSWQLDSGGRFLDSKITRSVGFRLYGGTVSHQSGMVLLRDEGMASPLHASLRTTMSSPPCPSDPGRSTLVPTWLDRQNNNFDVVRLSFAFLVYVGHYNWVFPCGSTVTRILIWFIGPDGQRCVQGFFVISGFLMFHSYTRSDCLLLFYEKRARRIFPAYATVIITSVLIGSCLTSLPIGTYFGSFETIKYLVSNLLFLNFIQPLLPGVFDHQLVPYVNAPLWTLKIEVAFYIIFPLLYFIGRKKTWHFAASCIILYTISIIYYLSLRRSGETVGGHIYNVLAVQLPGQLCYFMGGAFVAASWQYLMRHWRMCFGLSVLWVMGAAILRSQTLYPMGMVICVLGICLIMPPILRGGRHADLSYGIYILHFPIIQTVCCAGILRHHQVFRFIATTVAVLFLSYVMWHFVERPALRGRWSKRQSLRV
jgi:peptidoglycan/LPS O-acetylase OafA/YrhL